MVLEATMICMDNSEWMRNGDYRPSRFAEQYDTAAIVCSLKMQANLDSTVGVLAMAGRGVSVHVTPTNDLSKVAQLALKNPQNKQQQQRIIVLVGSPVVDTKNVLEAIGEMLKKNNVALDVVDFSESDDGKPEKLEALVAAVSSGDNTHIIHVPPGQDFLSNVILSSPMLKEEQESVFYSAACGVSGFEYSVHPELALFPHFSMEEDRARQEAADGCSETESSGQSSTSNDGTVIFHAETKSSLCTENKRIFLQSDVEYELLQLAHKMSIKDSTSGTVDADDADLLGFCRGVGISISYVSSGRRNRHSACQIWQRFGNNTQPAMSEVFGDQQFAQSIPYALPDVDLKDLLEWHELLIGPREALNRFQRMYSKLK